MSGEQIKPGYKRTEVGVIPEDWSVIPITALLGKNMRITYGVVQPGKNDPRGVLFVRGGDVYDGVINLADLRKITSAVSAQYVRTQLFGGELLISLVGFPGECALVPNELYGANIARQVAMVRFNKFGNFDREFICHFLRSNAGKKLLLKDAFGSAQQVINLKDVNKLQLPLPGQLDEQRAIATALSDVDALLSKLDQLIAKKRDLKQATMQQLLTGQTRLPGFSGEWEVKRLGEIAKLYQPETISQYEFTDHGYPVFGANGIVGMYNRFNHQSPQITVSCRGNCGTVNRTCGPAWITGNAMVVNLDGAINVDKAFVYYSLSYADLSILVTGSGIPQIVRTPLSAFAISLPKDHAEQIAIATIISELDVELAALEARHDKTRSLKQGMMQELLTGRIRLISAQDDNTK